MSDDRPDLILRPKRGTRPPTWRRYKGSKPLSIIASVFVPADSGSEFDHPTIEIRAISTYNDDDGSESSYVVCSAEVKFQRHRTDRERNAFGDTLTESMRRSVSGFLAAKRGRWSRAYGGRLSAEMNERAFLAYVMRILDRADESMRDLAYDSPTQRALAKIDCDLLTLIVSLRRIGVTVNVWSRSLRDKRAARRRPEVSRAA